MYNFDVEKATNGCINWIREWFAKNGKDCNAVLGISGGKDSSVVAALCVAALGKDRVIGVLMPQGIQSDIDYSIELCEFLGIRNYTVNVGPAVAAITDEIAATMEITDQSRFNLPARVRMATVYAVAQSQNGRVANTCNLSEDWVGYSTRYGDSVGDFAPLSNFTVGEVIAIGSHLGLPEKFVKKPPIDGLCGQTDEDKLGFTYETLDKYIREGIEPDAETKKRIDHLHEINLFKLRYMDVYEYEG
ncbi:MAG: NAD(+) synthase [Clostridia bacterium]|nr:NAD(+) synthase [Clostridia bacterium]MBQ9847399.1 NAD(+) synthase [Clostridia bacterium]